MNPQEKIARLTLLERVRVGGKTFWNCLCSCGKRKRIREDHIKSGMSKSCGCLTIEASISKATHGMCRRSGAGRSPEFITWSGMRDRCSNKNNPAYGRYGGRGIVVCKRWESFSAFISDMGLKPSKLHTIERINNSIGYFPSNCKWATKKDQANNRRSNLKLTLDGVTKTAAQWGEVVGIPPATLVARKRYGWTDSKALQTPLTKR